MSGSTIGGFAGGAIGFVASGFNPLGAQIGFMIGSSVGAYVDPIKVTGPRLTDSMAQTSTVGGVIPFGYGRFVTGGNVIWRDELKEHKKRQRQGKGGAKTTTYTYTRSYAIGVCQGPIYGFHWIKRNGKKVYTSSATATAEEKAYSAKWLEKVTLYMGSDAQMPDSTLVAVEGVGNVSAFRGLAYIVVENDDLTDMQGAIPQYEFCVIASPPEIYLTSKPYHIVVEDSIGAIVGPEFSRTNGFQQEVANDHLDFSLYPNAGDLRDIVQKLQNPAAYDEKLAVALTPEDGSLASLVVRLDPPIQSLNFLSLTPNEGQLTEVVVQYKNWPAEPIALSLTPNEGSLT